MQSAKVEKLFPAERNSDEDRLIRNGVDTSRLAPESMQNAWTDYVKAELPLAEYAVLYWLSHLQASAYGSAAPNEHTLISNFLRSHYTLVWIEVYVTINRQISDLEKLSALVDDNFHSMKGSLTPLEMAWRHAVLDLLHNFSSALLRSPNEAQHLDPTILDQYNPELQWQKASDDCYEKHMALRTGSVESQPLSSMKIDTDPKQQLYLPPGGDASERLGFLHFHRQSKFLLYADGIVSAGACAWLYCQHIESGHRLPPLIVGSPSTAKSIRLAAAATDIDSKYLCLHYVIVGPNPLPKIFLFRIDLHDNFTVVDWATLIFTIDCRWKIGCSMWEWQPSLQVTGKNIHLAGYKYILKDGECVQGVEDASEVSSLTDTAGHTFDYAAGAILSPSLVAISERAADTKVESRESKFYEPDQEIIRISNEGRYVVTKKSDEAASSIFVFDTLSNQDCQLFNGPWPLNRMTSDDQYAFYGGDRWLLFFRILILG